MVSLYPTAWTHDLGITTMHVMSFGRGLASAFSTYVRSSGRSIPLPYIVTSSQSPGMMPHLSYIGKYGLAPTPFRQVYLIMAGASVMSSPVLIIWHILLRLCAVPCLDALDEGLYVLPVQVAQRDGDAVEHPLQLYHIAVPEILDGHSDRSPSPTVGAIRTMPDMEPSSNFMRTGILVPRSICTAQSPGIIFGTLTI